MVIFLRDPPAHICSLPPPGGGTFSPHGFSEKNAVSATSSVSPLQILPIGGGPAQAPSKITERQTKKCVEW